jgi:hypothetical protein
MDQILQMMNMLATQTPTCTIVNGHVCIGDSSRLDCNQELEVLNKSNNQSKTPYLFM